MSGKAKVYQGVRVKMTVKELLQQRRAKQATVAEAEKNMFLFSHEKHIREVFGECSGNVQAGETFSPPYTVPYISTAPESSLSGGLPPWQFQNGSPCEEIPHYLEQLVDSCLQAEPLLEVPLALTQDDLPCSPESFQPALTCLVLEFLVSTDSEGELPKPGSTRSLGEKTCFDAREEEQVAKSLKEGQLREAAGNPLANREQIHPSDSGSPEAPDPSGAFDYGYSPSQMPPLAPLGYSCPALDGRSCMYSPPEERTCQPENHIPHTSGLPTCYCNPCGSQHLDTFRASEFFPYATLDCKDYAPSVSVTDDFWKDRSWDLCYS